MNGGALGWLVTGVSLKCLLGAFVVVVTLVVVVAVLVVVYFAIRLHH